LKKEEVMESSMVPAVDLDASPIQGQVSFAVLDCSGQVVRGQLSPHDASILFQMLVETANLKDTEKFRRLTVSFSSVRYVVARDDTHVYIVLTRAG
jgi:hypothetical protein